MSTGLDNNEFNKVIESLSQLAKDIDPQELSHWVGRIEYSAKRMCDDSKDKILFKHTTGRQLEYQVKDSKSRDCLVKSIEGHLTSVPLLIRQVLEKIKENLKCLNF